MSLSFTCPPTDPELLDLLRQAADRWRAMTPEQQRAEAQQQADAYVSSEMAFDEDSTVTVR